MMNPISSKGELRISTLVYLKKVTLRHFFGVALVTSDSRPNLLSIFYHPC